MADKFTVPGFADYFLEQRKHPATFLDKISQLIDWSNIEKLLRKKYKKVASADGRPAYPVLPMFKILLLQRWYGLSDPGLEEALNDRISFIRFSGFSISSLLPDHSTICRFRNALLDLNLYEQLLEEINQQLQSRGLLIKAANGAIVDATIIESSRRPRKVMDLMPEDRKEEVDEQPVITYSADSDATWIRKGKRPYYGYKAHLCVDAKNGFLIGGQVTPAHVADTTQFEALLNSVELPKGALVSADKGYASEKNRSLLKKEGYKDGIMNKAARNKPLSPIQRSINKLISSVRYKVEQTIGTLKSRYSFSRMRYLGLSKGNMELFLNAMAFNLKKAAAMVE